MITTTGMLIFIVLFLILLFGAVIGDALYAPKPWEELTFVIWMKGSGILVLAGIGIGGCLIIFSYIGKLFV